MTLVAGSISITYTQDITSGIATNAEANLSSIIGFIGTFFKILTFQLEGVPFWLNLFFIPVTMIVIYMIVDVLKDLVPFT